MEESKYSLLRKLVGLQPGTLWYVHHYNTVYSENWSVCNGGAPFIVFLLNTVYSENWSVCNRPSPAFPFAQIQFTQKIGRSATVQVREGQWEQIQFTQKIGRSATKTNVLRIRTIIQFTQKIGRSATIHSRSSSGYGIQFTQKIGRSATSGTGTKHLAEYSLLRKLVGLQLVASIAVATI